MRRLSFAILLVLSGPAGAIHAGTAFHDPIYGVSTTSNIVYGTGPINNGLGTLNLTLDLYRPTDVGGGFLPSISPGIVLIHGGSFVSGSKSDMAPLAQFYASYGYTVTSINYRLLGNNVPETHGPADFLTPPPPPFTTLPNPAGAYAINAAINDASLAMGWMRDNAALYNIDTAHIAIGGVSAGAITSLLQAYNNPAGHVAPQAVLSYLGAMYGTEATIQAGDAPAFVVHGDADSVVPFAAPLGAVATVNRMNAVGVYNEFYVQAGLGHTIDFYALFGGQSLIDHNMDFLARFLAPEPSSFVLAGLAAVALAAFARRKNRVLAG